MLKSSGEIFKNTIKNILDNFSKRLDKEVSTQGRIHNIRSLKNIIFVDLIYRGSKIQCSLISKDAYTINIGDLLSITGTCYKTKSGEPTIKINKLEIVSRWQSEISYKDISKVSSSPLKSLGPDTYRSVYYPYTLRKSIREFFDNLGFIEVQTPILGKNYNGGRSFPVISSYKGNKLGYNRTTFEDRMQALIGSGFEKIYQIGSIFRSENEGTFLEGYASGIKWEEGKCLLKDLLAFCVDTLVEKGIGEKTEFISMISNKEWVEVDLFKKVKEIFDIDEETFIHNIEETKKVLISYGVIDKSDTSVENIADKTSNYIAQQQQSPIIIDGYPIWSSPLYKEKTNGKLYRCRLYFPPMIGGFELGIQENDYKKLFNKIKEQRKKWSFKKNDERIIDSDLLKIISGGIPETLGFGLSPDKILKLWDSNFTIDPYFE